MPRSPYLCHALGGGPPPVPVHGGEVVLWRRPFQLELAKAEANGRGCPGAVGNRWISASATACERLATVQRGAAVPQRKAGEQRRLEQPLPL